LAFNLDLDLRFEKEKKIRSTRRRTDRGGKDDG